MSRQFDYNRIFNNDLELDRTYFPDLGAGDFNWWNADLTCVLSGCGVWRDVSGSGFIQFCFLFP